MGSFWRPGGRSIGGGMGMVLAWAAIVVLAEGGRFEGPYRVEVEPARRVRATLSQGFAMPGVAIGEWQVLVADPPDFDGQRGVSAEVRVEGVPGAEVGRRPESGARRQSLLYAHWFVPPDLAGPGAKVDVVYELTLMSRRLVRGEPGGPPASLPAAERAASLRSAGLIDHANAGFRRWLRENDLGRREGERDLDFAWRALEAIATTHAYRWVRGADPRASVVCRRGWGECGALSFLFSATLRAGGVPARVLAGRRARDSDPGKAFDPDSFHVRAEFWAEGVGWVPVDPSAAVGSRGPGPRRDLSRSFGRDDADLITLHFDSVTYLDRPGVLQQAALMVSQAQGVGRMSQADRLTVEPLPLPPASASPVAEAPSPAPAPSRTSKARSKALPRKK